MTILPRSLFWRFLLIIIIPIIFIQVITTYIFYQRHWENVNQYMESALISEIYILTVLLHNADTAEIKAHIIDSWSDLFTLKISPSHQHIQPSESSQFLRSFTTALSHKLNTEVISYYLEDSRTIRCEILMQESLLIIEFSNKRLQSSTTYIFILWMLGTSILLAIISLIFMKNQLRSILNLAEAAEKFGKGRNVDDFLPQGAKEIKSAGLAFIKMKKRLEKQIKSRTDLLNHISHDLRTPLTRIKLQLELMDDNIAKQGINKNLNEMQEMLLHYLNFAKGEGNEEVQKVDIADIANDVICNYNDKHIEFVIKNSPLEIMARTNAIKRAISNLMDNATKFSSNKILVTLYNTDKAIYIIIEDDGAGIPEDLHKEVFKPFNRLGKEQEGFGLGLTITKTIINAHGGSIILSQSSLGGLKVIVSLPY